MEEGQGQTDKYAGSGLSARLPGVDAFGKLIADVPSVRIDPETLAELHRQADAYGYSSVSEFIRDTLRVRVWGLEHVEHIQTLAAERQRNARRNAPQMQGGATS